MNTTLHLMVGLPCSGKTTVANQLKVEQNALLFTPDIWHLELFGDDSHSPNHDLNHERIEALIWGVAEQALELGVSVILDFGCWVKTQRDYFRSKARALGVSFKIHYMEVPIDKLKRRIAMRNGENRKDVFSVPLEDIDKLFKIFEPPTSEELLGN